MTHEGSEIARLRAQIDQEAQAAQAGLTGFAQGTSRHQTIVAKMERMTHALITEHGYEQGMQQMMQRLEKGEFSV
jgi:uncharacterized membrane protein YheB (UPF0754 family)